VGTEGAQAWAENMAKQQNVTTEEFLASDRGRYYNGAKIIMDGGLNVNVRPA